MTISHQVLTKPDEDKPDYCLECLRKIYNGIVDKN